LSSRKQPSDNALKEILALRDAGADVLVLTCDVAKQSSVQAACRAIAAHGFEVRHLMHAAGALADATITKQDWSRFETALAAKAGGAWNLHLATADWPLKSFVMFSAGAAMLGSPGQVNYAAANAFLDGLAQLRWSGGLPALAIAWGPWAEVGMAARSGRDWADQGVYMITPEGGAAALRRLLRDGIAYAAVLPIDWSRFAAAHPHDRLRPFFELVSKQRAESPGIADQWRVILAATPQKDRAAALEQLLVVEISSVLGLDPSRMPSRRKGFTEMGVDSLMAVELANRLSRRAGVKLPSTLVFEQPNLEALARFLSAKIGMIARTDARAERTVERQPTKSAAQVDVESMSAAEASAALRDELDEIGY
jgi:myxalamid-type polyketide synthase MxaB